MKSNYDAVLFDLDGTLTASHPGVIRCVTEALHDLGQPIPPDEILKKFIGPPLQSSFSKYCGLNEEQCHLAVNAFRKRYNSQGVFENTVFPGILELLIDLRESGAKVITATSKPQTTAEIVLSHFNLLEKMDFVSGAFLDERPHKKADLIQKALDQFDISPENAVMIGDTKFDIIGASSVGTDFIGVLFGYGTQEEMQDEGAVKFANTVEELRTFLLTE